MGQSNYNPDKCYNVHVYQTNGDGTIETIKIENLTFKLAKEYHGKMNSDSMFQFFREFPDGTIENITF